MKFLPRWRGLLSVLAVAVSSVIFAAPSDVVSVVGDSTQWTATKWSADDAALFGGMPVYHGTHKDLILVRYSFYVSNYDAEQLCPLWVAHVDEADALGKAPSRTSGHDPKWKRPAKFFPDPNVIAFSNRLHRPYVVHDSFTNCNPSELPSGVGVRTDITRGHNASNEEMKLQGDDDEGAVSQHESFSLANISPQTQGNNAPLWAELEKDCLIWAQKIGRVAVITGPVFMPDATLPAPVNGVLMTNGTKGPMILIPTHFFKIIIGKIDGKFAAVAFLVPHLSDLPKDGYKKFAVSIADVERATNLSFFPDAQIPPAKSLPDDRWLRMLVN